MSCSIPNRWSAVWSSVGVRRSHPREASTAAVLARSSSPIPTSLTWLEQQIHPLVGERIGDWLAGLPADTEIAVIEVPLLFESGMEKVFDTTIAVVTEDELRRQRAAARGHALVDEREARQLAQDEKAARAEHTIPNDGSVEDLEQALSALIEKLRR